MPNYIRRYRKRADLTQREVAFLLGSKSGAGISRHERFKQTPDLQTLFVYEILFRTPLRSIFTGTHQKAEQKLRQRIRLLIKKLSQASHGHRVARKIEILKEYLRGTISVGQGS